VPAEFDFGRSFTFTKEDPDWVSKILLGGVAALACSLLIGIPFVAGYLGRTLVNVAKDAPRPLPEWDDLGGLWSEGLRLYGLLLVVSLATAIYVPAALVRSALSGSFAAGLEWRENIAFIKANLANYALSLVAYLVAGFIAQFGFLLCCVGLFPAVFWSYLVLAVSLGQTARLAGASPRAS